MAGSRQQTKTFNAGIDLTDERGVRSSREQNRNRQTSGKTMQRPEVKYFFHEPSNTFSYVVWDPATARAAVVDAVLDYDAASGRTGHSSAD